MVKKSRIFFLFLLSIVSVLALLTIYRSQKGIFDWKRSNLEEKTILPGVTTTLIPSLPLTPTPTPTPKPLTFAELNGLYGPCAVVPVLMFHHVEDASIAKENGFTNLNVTPDFFQKQMEYLAQKGYTSITPSQLLSFFDSQTPLPAKPMMITFDDGYSDFASNAFPILSKFNFSGIVFLVTGLANNPGYLSWEQVGSLAGSGRIFFGNHTWSHKNTSASPEVVAQEVNLSDSQLQAHGLNSPKVFAYPLGIVGEAAGQILTDQGYRLAFTTRHSTVLCEKQRLVLPRIRIGNSLLNNYGL